MKILLQANKIGGFLELLKFNGKIIGIQKGRKPVAESL
jgi:hypothetical protein